MSTDRMQEWSQVPVAFAKLCSVCFCSRVESLSGYVERFADLRTKRMQCVCAEIATINVMLATCTLTRIAQAWRVTRCKLRAGLYSKQANVLRFRQIIICRICSHIFPWPWVIRIGCCALHLIQTHVHRMNCCTRSATRMDSQLIGIQHFFMQAA